MTPLDRWLWVYESPQNAGLTGIRKAVLSYVALKDGTKEGCFASVETIADKTGFSERTVQRTLAWLTKNGRMARENSLGRSTVYRITPDCQSPPSESHPRQSVTGDAESRVTVTPEPERNQKEKEHPPLTPPWGEEWERAVREGKGNHEVRVPGVRDWTPTRKRQIQKVHEKLKRSGKNWEDFFEEVREATNGGASSPIDLSLGRLTTKECERLDDLLEGKWRRQAPRAVAQEQAKEERDRALLDRIVSEKADAVPDHHAVLSNIRRAAGV